MGPLELTTVLQLIDEYYTEYHEIWKDLSTILSKQDEASLYQYLHTVFQQQGLTTRLLSSNPTLVYAETCNETTPTLLCYLDYDPQALASPQVQIIAASLLSLITYQRILATRTDLSPIKLKWFLGQKNFSHSERLQQSIELQPKLFQADAYLWYELLMMESIPGGTSNNPIIATGTKGYLSIELQVQTARTPLHSNFGAIAPNAAWRLLWALNSLKDAREDILIEGFYDTLMPLEDDAFQQLADLPDTTSLQTARWGMPTLLMGLQGRQMYYAHVLTPTCTINMLSSGEEAPMTDRIISSHHAIPASARAIVDFYLVPGQDPADILDKLKSHLRICGFSDIQVKLRYAGSPAYTTASNSFVQLVTQITKQVYGHPPIILPLLPEYVPIQHLIQNSAQPAIILPLYTPTFQKQQDDEQHILQKRIAHLTSIMLHSGKESS